MARSKHVPPNPKYEQALKSSTEVYSFLVRMDIRCAGVGVGYNKTNHDPCVVVRLSDQMPVDLQEEVEKNWPGTQIELVGRAITY